MKKVIIPFDGGKFPQGAFLFAARINSVTPILLTGIFLTQLNFSKFLLSPPYLTGSAPLPGGKAGEENIHNNIEAFKALCKKYDIESGIHEDLADSALPELTIETRFADLLIMGSEIFFKYNSANDYHIFLKDILHHAECPVMIIPENFNYPSLNILTYDGSTSSVFAIKQFAYLFPDLCDNKTILVYTSENAEDIPSDINIEELAASHFSNLGVTILKAGRTDDFREWVLKHENPILVSGSFGRSGFSSGFVISFVVNVIETHRIPVFIAHQ